MEVRRAEPSSDEEGDPPWVLDIQGEDLGVLIGRRGDTLNALQYITRLIVSREIQRRANFVIDVQGYKTRREVTLRKLALRMADEARYRQRMVKLEPMPPNERRIIHLALRNDPTVYTESEGMGDKRKVTIKLRSDPPS
jgi:spoIIIJ-associated protein